MFSQPSDLPLEFDQPEEVIVQLYEERFLGP